MNLVKAKKILYQAYNIANNGTVTPSNDLSKFIDDIIDNTHLTFKYILFTANFVFFRNSSCSFLFFRPSIGSVIT